MVFHTEIDPNVREEVFGLIFAQDAFNAWLRSPIKILTWLTEARDNVKNYEQQIKANNAIRPRTLELDAALRDLHEKMLHWKQVYYTLHTAKWVFCNWISMMLRVGLLYASYVLAVGVAWPAARWAARWSGRMYYVYITEPSHDAEARAYFAEVRQHLENRRRLRP
jgi:hypothetical protein